MEGGGFFWLVETACILVFLELKHLFRCHEKRCAEQACQWECERKNAQRVVGREERNLKRLLAVAVSSLTVESPTPFCLTLWAALFLWGKRACMGISAFFGERECVFERRAYGCSWS